MLGSKCIPALAHSIPSRRCQVKTRCQAAQQQCQPRGLHRQAKFFPPDSAAQPQNVCKKPMAGNCQQLNCITELIPPVPRPRPQDELGEANSPVGQPLERNICSTCSVQWGSYKLQHDPLGRFLSYLSPGSHMEHQGRGIHCSAMFSPHCQLQKGSWYFSTWCLASLALSPVLLQTGDYSLCFLVLSTVGSSIFVFFSIRNNKTILLFRDCQKRRFICRWWVQTFKQKFILWMLFQDWVLLSGEGSTSSLMPRDCLIKK